MYKSILVIDIDETVFNTHSKIGVYRSDKKIKELSNTEYNTYQLKDGERFDFKQFSDSQFFYDTSIPIEKNVSWIKRSIKNIERHKENNSQLMLFLTARNVPDDYNKVYDKFEAHGMNVRNPHIHFAFVGDLDFPTNAQKKSSVLEWYLRTNPEIKTIKMFDDDIRNIRRCAQVVSNKNDVYFYGILALRNGMLQRV